MLFVLVSLFCHCVKSEVCYRNQQLYNQIAAEKNSKTFIQCWVKFMLFGDIFRDGSRVLCFSRSTFQSATILLNC